MRREPIQLLFYFIIGSFLFFGHNVFSKVLISKIQIAGVSTTDEFIEFYNFSSSSQSLENWSLIKFTASGNSINTLISSFPSTITINPFSYYLIAHQDYIPVANTLADLSYTSSSLASNNFLQLQNQNQTLEDRVDWGTIAGVLSSAPNPSAGKSIVRIPDNSGNYQDTDDSGLDFSTTPIASLPFNSLSPARTQYTASEIPTSTVSSTPSTSSTPEFVDNTDTIDTSALWSLLKINEFMPDPTTGTEWIELYNANTDTINIAGGTLCDSRDENCAVASLSGTIPGHDWFTIFLSSSKLNNDGDNVVLKNPFEETIDQIDYGNGKPLPEKGQSLARLEDGIDTNTDFDWAITTQPTPNSQNTIISPPPPPVKHSSGGGGSSSGTLPPTSAPTTSSKTKTSTSTKAATSKDSTTILWKLATPSIYLVGSSTLFDAHRSADPRGGEIVYRWNFGDNSSSTDGSQVFHTFATSGIFSITINATSTQGTTGSKSYSVKVVPDLPIPEGIFISGLSPRPEAEDEEWISIDSHSATSTNISQWQLGVGDKWYTLPPNTFLKPSSTLRFSRTATHLVLNNDGGTISLSDPYGKPVDLLSFEQGSAGQSYLFTSSGWQWLPKNDSTSTKKVLGVKVTTTNKDSVTSPLTAPGEGGRMLAQPFTIADARAAAPNTTMMLTGVVESLPGAPGVNYFYIKDHTAGIQIYSYKKSFPKLTLGETVRVNGQLGTIQGLPRLKTKTAADIIKVSAGALKPVSKSIADVDDSDFGTLLTLEGDLTKSSSASLYLDDGSAEALVGLMAGAHIDKKPLKIGVKVRITGIVDQNSTAWRLTPRSPADIVIITSTPSSLQIQSQTTLTPSPSQLSSSSPSTTTKIAFGAGGLFLIALAFFAKKILMK